MNNNRYNNKYISKYGKHLVSLHYVDGHYYYRLCNTTKVRHLNESEREEMGLSLISNKEFNQKVNEFFRNIKDEWTYLGTKYRKMQNFDKDYKNDERFLKMPVHSSDRGHYRNVYYQGKIRRAYVLTNKLNKVYLFKDNRPCGLTTWKNLAPIFNVDTKSII